MNDGHWTLFCQEIDALLQTGQYAWADDVLRRMRALVQTRHQVTDGQRLAVQCVRAATERSFSASTPTEPVSKILL